MLDNSTTSTPTSRALVRMGILALPVSFSVLVLGGCGANNYWGESSWDSNQPPLYMHQQPAAGTKLAEPARDELSVAVRDVNVMARELRIRARVTNHYDQVVRGVRYRVELISTDGERTLGTEYFETDEEIPPGGTAPVRLVLESIYTTTVPRLTVEAQPMVLGGSEQAVPDHWEN